MILGRRPWQEELDIIDRTMRAISSVTDPEEMVGIYWDATGIGGLIPVGSYMAVSRRNVEPPDFIVTRSSRFTEDINPFTQRERLPRLRGGLAGEIAYANKPVIIDDLPSRLKPDDPSWFFLQGFQSLVALPQYDGGEGLNVTIMLMEPGQQLEPTMIPLLHWQAGLFGRGTTNLVLRNQLQAAWQMLDRELQVVGNIQRSLLPAELPPIDGFDLAAWYNTSARAGGDYYDFFPLDGGRWGVFIADVSGHGTPAAVLMAITHALAHAQPGTHFPPASLLGQLNRQLARSYTRNGTFVTAFYAVLDPAKRTLEYSLAGHNPPRLVRGDKVISLDRPRAMPLGIDDDETYGQTSVTLEKGDLLLLYTDGITETMAPTVDETGARNMFGVPRLDQLLLDCRPTDARNCIERVRAEVTAFCSNAPVADDQTLIAMRVL
jgi:sigma-B regulation protein RsbU (phosphoserine phosphatase)